MEVVPKEVAFAAAKLDGFNRNRYRIETTGATTAGPSSIVTINLPDAAVLDLRSGAIKDNDLIDRLAADSRLGLTHEQLSDLIGRAQAMTGLATEQVNNFCSSVRKEALNVPAAASYTPSAIL